MTAIDLPYPGPDLSQNARVHWSRKARAVKAYRKAAWALCRQAGWLEEA